MLTELIVLAGTGTILAAAGLLVLRARATKADTCLRACCPACRQKVRYPAKKGGFTIMCPRCSQPYVLPKESATPLQATPRYVIGRKLVLRRRMDAQSTPLLYDGTRVGRATRVELS